MSSLFSTEAYDNPDLSYKVHRLILGIAALILPFVLYFGNWIFFGETQLLASMSGYYHSGMGDVLVGLLFAVGLFLMAYKGYDWMDNWAGVIAGIFAIGIAIFPTTESGPLDTIGVIHFVCSVGFYTMLTVYALFLFPKSDKKKEDFDRPKILRNRVYYVSGIVMAVTMIILLLDNVLGNPIGIRTLTFWAEAIANTAFGVSWFVKSGFIVFRDE